MERESRPSPQTRGKFSIYGLALDKRSREVGIEQYQCAMNKAEREIARLGEELGMTFNIGVSGSIEDFSNFRIGVYDPIVDSYEVGSRRKLMKSLRHERCDDLPSDLDVLVSPDRDLEEDQYLTLNKRFTKIATDIYWDTGILVEITFNYLGREVTPISELRGYRLAHILKNQNNPAAKEISN